MLDATDRTALASLSTLLAPDADPAALVGFVGEHRAACLDELGDSPGNDQHRTTLIRVLLGEDDAADALSAADAALLSYPDQVAEAGRSLLLRRHPAWVGLAVLERAGGPALASDAVYARAISLANSGFAAATTERELADGEALWAMAEQAESVSWSDRAQVLLARAEQAVFADPAHRAEVRLLLGLQRAEQGLDGAVSLLIAVATQEDAEIRSRVHAAFVLGHEQADQAARWFDLALDLLDDEDDAEVRARIVAAREVLVRPS